VRVRRHCVVAAGGLPAGTSARSSQQGRTPSGPATAYAARSVLTRRWIGILMRAHPPASLRAAVAALVRQLRRLQVLYLIAEHGVRGAAARAVTAAESRAAHIARLVGVQECAPGGSGSQRAPRAAPTPPGGTGAPAAPSALPSAGR